MAYNWRKHVKNPKNNEDFAPYIVNTNTNTISVFEINPHYISGKDLKNRTEAEGGKLKKNAMERRRRHYVKLRVDDTLDYKKTVPVSRVNKWIHQGYAQECRSLNKAKYLQALLRMEKSEEHTSEQWRKIAEELQDKFPEDLI